MNMLKFSNNSRCASLAMVSNTMEDFPEPDTPVKMMMLRLGSLNETSLRLFSRATNLDIFLNHADLCSLRIVSPGFPWLPLSERLCSGPSRLRSWLYQGTVEHRRIGNTSSLSYGRCAEDAQVARQSARRLE